MTVLIVDDASSTRKALRRVLRRALPQAEVIEAGTVEIARAWLLAKPIDLLLLDWTIGRGSGEEILERLHLVPERPTTVVVSAITDPEVAARARERGASAWLVKPFGVEELTEAIARATAA